jgi:hypothetical protein
MCNDFLDSYTQSLQVCKVSSTPWTYCIQNTLPKSAKSRFGFLRPLGVKFVSINELENIFLVKWEIGPKSNIMEFVNCLKIEMAIFEDYIM